MGFLDAFSSDDPKSAAMRQGLLRMGLALMQAKGNPGQILGQAGTEGVNGIQSFQDRQFKQKLQQEALAEIARKKVLETRQDAQYNAGESFKADLLTPRQLGIQSALSANSNGPTIENLAKVPPPSPTMDMLFKAVKSGQMSVADYTKAHASMAKESNFAKINPSEYTRESIAKYSQTHNPADLVPSMKPGEAARLDFERWQWNNLSPAQQQELRIKQGHLVNDNSRTGSDISRTGYETGIWPTGYGTGSIPTSELPAGAGLGSKSQTGTRPTIIPPPNMNRFPPGPGAVGSGYVPSVGTVPRPTVMPVPYSIPREDILLNSVTPKERQVLLVAKPAAESSTQSIMQSIDRSIDIAKELRNHPGLSAITGRIGQYPALDMMPETLGARGLQNNLMSMVGINALNEMRALSKTGGAVGQVSDREWPILQQSVAALDAAQNAAEYKVALKNLETQLESSQKRVRNAYESTYGKLKYDKAQHVSQGSDPNANAVQVKSMDEALKLNPGQIFIDPYGTERTR